MERQNKGCIWNRDSILLNIWSNINNWFIYSEVRARVTIKNWIKNYLPNNVNTNDEKSLISIIPKNITRAAFPTFRVRTTTIANPTKTEIASLITEVKPWMMKLRFRDMLLLQPTGGFSWEVVLDEIISEHGKDDSQ